MVKLNNEPVAFVRLCPVDPGEVARQTAAALAARGMTAEDLAGQLHYCSLERSQEKIEQVLAGTLDLEQLHILRKVAEILQLDPLHYCGERWFFHGDDYQRYLFRPYLMRVAERSRPSQITIAGFYGLTRCFLVATFPDLLNRSWAEQQDVVRAAVVADLAQRDVVPFFGKTVGYAFFHEYGAARPLSLTGEELAGMRVKITACCAGVVPIGLSRNVGVVHIPRFEPQPDRAATADDAVPRVSSTTGGAA